MTHAPDLLAGAMLAALVVYTLSGGADFGGGVWDLLARGPRAAEQRRLIESALAPVWEANHVWLVFVVIVLFTAFPAGFSVMSTRMHGTIIAALLGIVLRGSALVFRQYGGGGAGASRWGALFAAASASTPFFLGMVLAGATAGTRTVAFALAVGTLAVTLCAYLAAVYLAVEAQRRAPALEGDFRRRAIAAWGALALAAVVAAAIASSAAPRFAAQLIGWPRALLVVGSALAALGAVGALVKRRPRLARALAIVQVAAIVIGWGVAQHPLLIAPDITVAGAAAPQATLDLLLPVLAIGALVVLPPFYWLLRVFKSDPPAR